MRKRIHEWAGQSTADLIEYAHECCVFRALTAEERAQFMLGEAGNE